MHLHPAGVIALAVALGAACKNSPAPAATRAAAPHRQDAQVAAAGPAKLGTKPAPVEPLCHGRPRCTILDRRPSGSPDAAQVVVVRLGAPADAATDEDRCDRREYWLSRPAGDLLLAVDCEAQWGADNAGPASLDVAAGVARFHYVEFLSDDGCEIVDATLRLPQARIETQTRHWGTVVRNQCRASRKAAPIPALGPGTPDHPVLVLHRP